MILERYILRELFASFAFAFCTVLSVCLVGTMFQVFRTFPGVGFEVLGKALPLATGAMASWVMLVASCTSSTLVYARLAAENEITAMRTCGIHLWRIATPAILLGLMLVGAAYPLNEIVVPWTRHNRRLVFRDSLVFALRKPPAGQQDFRIGNTRIVYTDYVDGKMVQPTISKFKDGNLIMQVFAPAGKIVVNEDKPEKIIIQVILTKPRVWQTGEYKTILMLDGRKFQGKPTDKDIEIDIELKGGKKLTFKKNDFAELPVVKPGEVQTVHLRDGKKLEGKLTEKEAEVDIDIKGAKKLTVKKKEIQAILPPAVEESTAENDLTLEVPTEDLDKLKRQPVDQPAEWLWERIFSAKDAKVRNPLLLILHTRYAASLAPLLLVLVGMPIGVMVSKGSRLAGLGAALPPLLIYFISYFIFQGLGQRNRVPPLVAAYVPDLFLGVVAMLLVAINVRR